MLVDVLVLVLIASAALLFRRRRRGRAAEREHPIQARFNAWVHRTRVAFFVAYGVLLLGVWAEFGGMHLSGALHAAWDNLCRAAWTRSWGPLGARVDWWAVMFFVALGALGLLIGIRLRADDERQTEEKLDIFRALNKAPNIGVVNQYAEGYWPSFTSALRSTWPGPETPEDERVPAMARSLRDAIAVVAEMARRFSRADGARYGANLMLIVRPEADPARRFPPGLVARLRFHSPGALGELAGILYLPSDLVIGSIDDGPDRNIPLIALPVPGHEADAYGHRLVIPGAPAAVVTGQPSTHEDTTLIAAECSDFDATTRHEIARYFSRDGDGRDVASFVSLRLGDKDQPVGVLNIDSDRRNVLGRHDEFYITFYALVRPMLDHLRDAAAEYAAAVAPTLWDEPAAQPGAAADETPGHAAP